MIAFFVIKKKVSKLFQKLQASCIVVNLHIN